MSDSDSSDSKAGQPTQLRLALEREPEFERDLFIVSDSNREAVATLDAWPAWLGGAVALIGPEGSGKTHLSHTWARRTHAISLGPGFLNLAEVPAGPVLVDRAEGMDETTLFHLINRAGTGASLLLTARLPPRAWPTTLPDLRSRLNAMPTAELAPPDDALLEGVLKRFFRNRHIRADPELLTYLLRRMERSAPAALAIVERLDALASQSRREVNRALAREIFDGLD